MSRYLILITILSNQFTFCQSYDVLEAKKAYKLNGDKIRKGTHLYKDDSVTINQKGLLLLNIESAIHLKLGQGNYDVYSEAQRLNAWYAKHLILTDLLKKQGLLTCKFRYKSLVVPGSNRHYEVDRIDVDQKYVVSLKSDTASLTIKWNNTDYRYQGKHFLVLRDYYNKGFVEVLGTYDNSITLNPGKYGHRHMYYSIIAENCRASLRYKIEVKTVKEHPAKHFTNFIKSDY